MAKEEDVKKAEEKKARYEIVQITTETAPAIKDNENNEYYDALTAICTVMNDIAEIKRQLKQ